METRQKYATWYGQFIIHVKSGGIYVDLADVKKRSDKSKYEAGRPLPIRKKQENNRADEWWIGWKNNERNCSPKTQDV